MTDAFLSHFEASLPAVKISVYHLGLFREKGTLEPVEYYNKLPVRDQALKHAYVLDPLLATGGTAAAVISILRYAIYIIIFPLGVWVLWEDPILFG